MAGAAAVYSWSGAQEATLLLIKNSVGGWDINEIRGIDDEFIDRVDQQIIKKEVENALKSSSRVVEQKGFTADRLWLTRALSRPFPLPPVTGTDLFVPILSGDDLLRKHKEMGIPFDNFWMLSVLRWKTAYFFKWLGGVSAIILAVFGDMKVVHIECLGRGATSVPRSDRSRILRSVI